MASTILLGSLYLDGHPTRPGIPYTKTNGAIIKLGNSDSAVPIPWIPVGESLFCTWNLLTEISMATLVSSYLTSGKRFTIDGFLFSCSIPFTGSKMENKENEWNRAMAVENGDNVLWHWRGVRSWCQEQDPSHLSNYWTRGDMSPLTWLSQMATATTCCGWRPVLKPVKEYQVQPQIGQELIVWSNDCCIRGKLMDMTEYDMLLGSAVYGMGHQNNLFMRMSDGTMVIDRSRINGIQIQFQS